MKRSILSIFALLSLLAAGCVHDEADCVSENNFVMKFSLRADSGADIFNDNIETIDVLFFDDAGLFVMRKSYTPAMLDSERSVALTLDPGGYRIVCWANAGSNSSFCNFVEGTTHFRDCYVEIPGGNLTGGDRIYYSPYAEHPHSRSGDAATRAEDYTLYAVDVPRTGSTVKEYGFSRAHRTVNVYISGLDDSPEGARLQPGVEAKKMWARYDFFFNTHGDHRRDLSQQTLRTVVDGKEFDHAAFHSGHGEITDDMEFTVSRTSDGEAVATVNLLEFVTQNPPATKSEINILVTFLDDHSISITVPEWISTPVNPGV